MEARNYKLPPLPNKKFPSIQIENNQSEKLVMPAPRVTSYSREK